MNGNLLALISSVYSNVYEDKNERQIHFYGCTFSYV